MDVFPPWSDFVGQLFAEVRPKRTAGETQKLTQKVRMEKMGGQRDYTG